MILPAESKEVGARMTVAPLATKVAPLSMTAPNTHNAKKPIGLAGGSSKLVGLLAAAVVDGWMDGWMVHENSSY